MAKSKQAKSAIPYARRLAEDEYVQEQLRNAAVRLREAYGRATRQGGRAAEGKKLYRSMREAATSIRKAAGAIDEPPKPKRRGRKLLALALAGGAAALLLSQKRKAHENSTGERARIYDSAGPSSGNGASQESFAAESVGVDS